MKVYKEGERLNIDGENDTLISHHKLNQGPCLHLGKGMKNVTVKNLNFSWAKISQKSIKKWSKTGWASLWGIYKIVEKARSGGVPVVDKEDIA